MAGIRMALVMLLACGSAFAGEFRQFESTWSEANDRVWLGPDYWANPMEDWRVEGGRAVCLGGPNRNVALLTRAIDTRSGGFWVEVRTGLVSGETGSTGFRIGLKDEIPDYRAAALRGAGINAGMRCDGHLFIGGAEAATDGAAALRDGVVLRLDVDRRGETAVLRLTARDGDGGTLGTVQVERPWDDVRGLVALVNNHQQGKAAFWFDSFRVDGDAVSEYSPTREFGPILWAMHTVSRGVLKITAQMPPLGPEYTKTVMLELDQGHGMEYAGEAVIHPDACTATFRVPGMDARNDTTYRLTYRLADEQYEYTGVIRKEPKDRPLVIAGFTGNKDYLFPNLEVVRNVGIHDPDVLFFSGDQIYEDVGGYGIIREPADRSTLNYLRKWYLLGWAFGGLMRDRPAICLPDDHDVYQGNIWGAGGIDCGGMVNHAKGGYAQPVRMIRAVHLTQTAHHPDLYDPTPLVRNIPVFHGDMVYGGVHFAIVADRMFKSGPEGKVNTWEGRPDHVKDPSYDVRLLDKPGLKLLGDRQIAFLENYVTRDEGMKILLSQTIFCNLANYHGPEREFIYADLDSNGWPQSGRNRALEVLRRGHVFHLAGDQHLPSIVHHGIEEFGDAIWSFCVPSIAAGYPRRWIPDEEGRPVRNRPASGLPNTGEYLDGLGNRMTVHAIGNPEEENRPGLVNTGHDKASGYGIVRADPAAGTITMECWRLDVDVAHSKHGDQFPGWPMTVRVGE